MVYNNCLYISTYFSWHEKPWGQNGFLNSCFVLLIWHTYTWSMGNDCQWVKYKIKIHVKLYIQCTHMSIESCPVHWNSKAKNLLYSCVLVFFFFCWIFINHQLRYMYINSSQCGCGMTLKIWLPSVYSVTLSSWRNIHLEEPTQILSLLTHTQWHTLSEALK